MGWCSLKHANTNTHTRARAHTHTGDSDKGAEERGLGGVISRAASSVVGSISAGAPPSAGEDNKAEKWKYKKGLF